MSMGKSITLTQAKSNGLQVCFTKYLFWKISLMDSFQACIERMLNLTDHLRRLKVDRFEYVAMKVIVLLQTGGLTGFEIKSSEIIEQFYYYRQVRTA